MNIYPPTFPNLTPHTIKNPNGQFSLKYLTGHKKSSVFSKRGPEISWPTFMCMYINTYYDEMQFCLRNLRHLQQLQIIVQESVYWGGAKQPLPITFLSVCPFDMTKVFHSL